MYIVKAGEIRALEERTFEKGKPSLELMENAGRAAYEEFLSHFGTLGGKKIAVMCGVGKNGGDGYVIARYLKGNDVYVCSFGNENKIAPDTLVMKKRCGIDTTHPEKLPKCDIYIDAIFGIGFHGELRGEALEAAEIMNSSGGFVLSIDIPTGVGSDDGSADANAVRAEMTVTYSYPKAGCVLLPGASHCGKLIVRDVGVEEPFRSNMEIIDRDMVGSAFPKRRRDAHKGTFGHVAVIGGCSRYSGAPCFTANAAVRAGSGLVTLLVPESIHVSSCVKVNEAMVYSLPDVDGAIAYGAKEVITDFLRNCDAAAIGPGLSRAPAVLTREIIGECALPLVIDADGINALESHTDILKKRQAPSILTPHDGEFRRLTGTEVPQGGPDRVEYAKNFAYDHSCVLVLKGYRTIVTDGGRIYINTTGNPGMAKGGSGDVLTGIILSLLGQGRDPLLSACAGAYIHGIAGDIAAEKYGEYSMTPSDMIALLPEAIKEV
ncbi:MAG: NAD(P)H-hydrate dehydratase [Clostridiales bacterium]|nr:NAD(P)H-hydrate dehydratase [Clostridiales bacterium]